MKDTRFVRYALFYAFWFFAVPVAVASLLVWFVARPETGEWPGLLSGLRTFGREQPVPSGIIAFTLVEMLLWGRRHALPFAGAAFVGGRSDLTSYLRRQFEEAAHLLDEAERILSRKRSAVERTLSVSNRDSLVASLDELRNAMHTEPLEPARFERAFQTAAQNVDAYLAPWRKGELREYAESIGIAISVALLLRAFAVEAFKIPSPSMVPTLQVGDHIFVNKSAYGPMIPWLEKRLFSNMPPHHGDVIVFQFPEKPEQDFIKRVVALPGDKLEALDGRPIINGWRPPECKVGTYRYAWGEGILAQHDGDLFVEYLEDTAFLTFFDRALGATPVAERKSCNQDHDCEAGLACRSHLCGELQGPYLAKEGEVWVMGDNRNNSHDSRGWWEGRGGGVPFHFIKGRALIVWLSFGMENAWERIGLSVMGRPKMPPAVSSLQPVIDKCFKERPPLSETTPPPPVR